MSTLCISNPTKARSPRIHGSSFARSRHLDWPHPIARNPVHRRPFLCSAIALGALFIASVSNAQAVTGEAPSVHAAAGPFAWFVAEAAQRFEIPAA